MSQSISVSQQIIIQRLVQWAEDQAHVRAMLLTSTRSNPAAQVDRFSDYDVILAVTDVANFFGDRTWLGNFGSVLVVYRDPIRIEYGAQRFAYITQYEVDFLKIDFSVVEIEWLREVAQLPSLPDELDVGYQVLMDKDALTVDLMPPTHMAFIPVPPSRETYLELIETFFHEVTYVAKNLWRGELLPAKYSLDNKMKASQLRRMLEWQIGINTNWTQKTGSLGKGLKQYVANDVWAGLESTYVGSGNEENWWAMLQTIDLFHTVAVSVGDSLGYTYPADLHQQMMMYLEKIEKFNESDR